MVIQAFCPAQTLVSVDRKVARNPLLHIASTVGSNRKNRRHMTSEDIKQIIKTELKTEPDINNVFGLDMSVCLIEPIKQKYKNSNDATEIYELWTVLEETADKTGYKLFFDEEENMFGLAIKSDNDELINIGLYGSFLKTLYSM